MASYESLTFQLDLFKQELFNAYDSALNEAVDYVVRNFKPDGGSKTGEFPLVDGKQVTVSANSLRAWVIEYGAGLEADISRNPYWDEYVRSGFTSPRRTSGRIVRRGKGEYTTFDTKTGEFIQREGGNPDGGYLPDSFQKNVSEKPEPFVQEMLQQAYSIFETRAYSLSQSINPEKFFIKSTINL